MESLPTGYRQHRGHQGQLQLTFSVIRDRTRITKQFQTPPLRASQVLYLDSFDQATVYLVETSGGLVAGDHHQIEIILEKGAQAALIPQSATKIYPSKEEKYSSQTIHVSLKEEARLEWRPESIIPFQGSRFQGRTKVRMTPSASLLWADILSPGRLKSGESFSYDDFDQRFELWMGEECLIYDALRLQPKVDGLEQIGLFEQFLYMGSLWYIAPQSAQMDEHNLYQNLEQNKRIRAGVTRIENVGLHLRWLASDLCLLKKEMEKIWGMLAES